MCHFEHSVVSQSRHWRLGARARDLEDKLGKRQEKMMSEKKNNVSQGALSSAITKKVEITQTSLKTSCRQLHEKSESEKEVSRTSGFVRAMALFLGSDVLIVLMDHQLSALWLESFPSRRWPKLDL